MDKENKRKIDAALALMFFGCNLPFSVVETPLFKEFLKQLNPNYKPPTRKTLSETLLDDAYQKLQIDQYKEQERTGTAMLDGWKNSSNNSKQVILQILRFKLL
jgi:hypothetical protein